MVAVYGGLLGAMITNPVSARDQGVDPVEELWVNLTGPADTVETATTVAIQPGQTFTVPPGQTLDVWVNARTSGHRFTSVVMQPSTSYPPTPIPGTFPPSGPVVVQEIIPSYLYVQYADDDDLQAFVRSYNQMAQTYLSWFVDIGLPVYTDEAISGSLLDWVGSGLYGIPRPALSSGKSSDLGPLNTYGFAQRPTLAQVERVGPNNIVVTSDDIYKRILTWHLYRGDGRVFNLRWLKRRIERFLDGVDGSDPPVNQTYRISVTFGVGNQVDISLVSGVVTVTGGAFPGMMGLNTTRLAELDSTRTSLAPIPNAEILAEAINSGALELPFQYDYVVNTQGV